MIHTKNVNPFLFISSILDPDNIEREIYWKKRNIHRKTNKNIRSCDTNIVMYCCGEESRDSSVGIATRYGLDGLGIESRWGQDFTHKPKPAVGPPNLLYNRNRVSFPGLNGRDVALITTLFWWRGLRKSREDSPSGLWWQVIKLTLLFAAMSSGGVNKLFRKSRLIYIELCGIICQKNAIVKILKNYICL
jgi:hypothetical protein